MWQKPEGAKPIEKLPSDEFWKPTEKGQVLIGRVLQIYKSRFLRKDGSVQYVAQLSPALIYPRDGAAQGFGSMSVNLNSWLEKLITSQQIGTPVAIAYKGMKDTPAGDMRVFVVYPLLEDQFQSDVEKVSPHLLYAQPTVHPGDAPPSIDKYDPEEDDLPF